LAGFDATRLAPVFAFVAGEVAALCAAKASDITAVHDVSGGGLAAALAEMVASTGLGATTSPLRGRGEYFAEFPGRFVVATSDADALLARAAAAGVPAEVLGTVGGDALRLGDDVTLEVATISERRANALVNALDGEVNLTH